MTELLNIELIEGDYFGEYNESQRRFIFNESAALMYNLKAGEMIIMPANKPHALRAVQKYKMLLTMIKSQTD